MAALDIVRYVKSAKHIPLDSQKPEIHIALFCKGMSPNLNSVKQDGVDGRHLAVDCCWSGAPNEPAKKDDSSSDIVNSVPYLLCSPKLLSLSIK